MTTIALENLQGWVSSDWDDVSAKKDNELTKLRAQSLGAKE
jgi:ferrochelatase